MDLKNLRHYLLSKRRELEPFACIKAGANIKNQLLAHPFLKDSKKVIASYASFQGEIDTKEINLSLLNLGHVLALPKVCDPKQGKMDFFSCTIEDLNQEGTKLITGAFGISEPLANPALLMAPDAFEVVLLPLLAFDNNGHRLGMGGGFYDRFLKKLSKNCRCIGLAYDFQEVSFLPKQEWDMDLDEIYTPTRHLVFKAQ